MTNLFSPCELEIILWYHSRAEDWRGDSIYIEDETLQKLFDLKLLEVSGLPNRNYAPTNRLHAYVDGLCSLPLPVQKWVIENE